MLTNVPPQNLDSKFLKINYYTMSSENKTDCANMLANDTSCTQFFQNR